MSCFGQTSQGESFDSTLTKRLSISGFTLCKTSLKDLRNLADDLQEVDVEEMDLPKDCYSQDSRFTNGEGYASKQFPGMIFQKGNQSDYIGKSG